MRSMAHEIRAGKAVLIALLAIFVVLGVAVVWVWRSPATQPDLAEGRAVTEAFLERIRAGKPQEAWESTTAEFKSAEGRESFVRYVKKNAILTKPLAFVSVQTVTAQGQPRAEYIYRSENPAGTVRLLAGNDQGSWRVDRITLE